MNRPEGAPDDAPGGDNAPGGGTPAGSDAPAGGGTPAGSDAPAGGDTPAGSDAPAASGAPSGSDASAMENAETITIFLLESTVYYDESGNEISSSNISNGSMVSAEIDTDSNAISITLSNTQLSIGGPGASQKAPTSYEAVDLWWCQKAVMYPTELALLLYTALQISQLNMLF